MNSLGVTLGGVAFPQLVYHLVLVYSNIEAVQICFSESFESLVEGFETCLWQIGGTPRQHRTDHLSAAIHPLDADGRAQAKRRYEPMTTMAAIDRVVHHSVILDLMGIDSYRAREATLHFEAAVSCKHRTNSPCAVPGCKMGNPARIQTRRLPKADAVIRGSR